MRFHSVGFIICQIIVRSQTENLSGADNPERNERDSEDEILQFTESRYRLKNPYPEFTKRESDLPVTFQAPRYEANDYWNHREEKDGYGNRRTFFEDPYSTRTTFPGLYQFMTSLFTSGRDEISSTPEDLRRPNWNHPTPPYPFERPFGLRPTTNYIPSPKPIRASVIKLETVTRSPNLYPSFFYESTTGNSPHLERILNQVLIENSKKRHHDDLSFHYQREPVSSVGPPSVLPKPVYAPPPTTLRPFLASRFTDDRPRDVIPHRPSHYGRRYNATGHKYPDSVQDQLPHLNIGRVKIPYVSETALTNIFTTLPPSNTKTYFKYSRNPFPYSPANISGGSNRARVIPRRKGRPATTNTDRIRFDVTQEPTEDSIPIKKRNQSEKPSVEHITNLTVEGLSKVEKDNANIHNYVNYFNIRNLINYEMEKLDTPHPESQTATAHLVNLNDELSLDAKILKDTNWDGFTGITSITTTLPPAQGESTTANKTESGDTTQKPDVMVPTTTVVPTESTEKETNPTTQTVVPETTTASIGTTTEITTTEDMTTTVTNEPITTTEEIQNISTQTSQRRDDAIIPSTTEPTPTEVEPSSTTQRTFHSKRKYNRRPKTSNFTPYPTASELQKKVINRNNFPKRQKPNITLTFGNKNIVKTKENYGRDEVMRFSDEDVAKRKRKIGKRRQVIKRKRVTTSERPARER